MLNLRAWIKGLLVQDENDRTKELSVEVDSAATTGTRTTLKSSQTADRTVNLPDATDTLMGRATTDTVSNKTLDNSNSATFVDNSLTIQGDGDATKQAQFNADTISTATTRTLSLPDGDTTLLGADTTQTVENKTIDGTAATGNNTITADADNISFDNSTSGLTATDVQAAVDEVEGRLDTAEAGKLDGPGTHADNLLFKSDGVNTNDMQATGISVDDSNNVTGVNDLTIAGDLTVNGTTTTLNTATLDVEDTNITVNKNGTDPSAEGAGLTVERAGTDGSLIYEDALTSKFKLGALGSEVEIADVSSAQTIANKTIDGNNNTITNIDLTSDVTGTLPISSGGTGQTTQTEAFDALSPTTTKGDIIARDTSDNIRIAVGTNGQALLADSTQAGGVRWGNVSASNTVTSIDNTDSPYSLTTASNTLLCDASSGTITVNLPTASGNSGVIFDIKKIGTTNNAVTIDGNGSETIDGSLTYIVYLPNESVKLISDGSNWQILDRKIEVVAVQAKLASAITSTTTGDVVLDTETLDTHSAFNTGTGTFTAPAPGKYSLSGGCLFGSLDGATNAFTLITVNGSGVVQSYATTLPAASGSAGSSYASVIVDLSVGDTVNLYASGDASFDIDGSNRTYLTIRRIGL